MDYKDYKDDMAKVPFYMTFPMQNLYLMEMEYEKDMERMKSLYPKEIQIIMPVIEKHCDELEYEGSRIYDEEPDAYMMQEEIMKLYEKVKKLLDEEKEPEIEMPSAESSAFYFKPPKDWGIAEEELAASNMRPPMPPPPPPPPQHRGCNGWLCSMVGVLFQDEIYRRRCRHRRCQRWW